MLRILVAPTEEFCHFVAECGIRRIEEYKAILAQGVPILKKIKMGEARERLRVI